MTNTPPPFLVYGSVFFVSVFFAAVFAFLISLAGRQRKTRKGTIPSALQLSPLDALLAIQQQITEIEALPHGASEVQHAVEKLLQFLIECRGTMPDLAGDFTALHANLNSSRAQADAEEGAMLLRLTELYTWCGQQIKRLQAL